MLVLFFACVGVGLLAPRFGRREQLGIAALAGALTALYYLAPYRFM
jgi:hypothetical protein